MAYLDRSSRNWGALVATALAVPMALVWVLIEVVGGTLACEGVEEACGPSAIGLMDGLVSIVVIAGVLGWLLNRVIGWVSHDR